MSKEMTPKDSLKQLNNFISREKHIDSERNKTINKCVDTLNQALERFELLEKENSNQSNLIKRLNRLIVKAKQENQELYKQIKQLEKENQELKEKISKFEKPILYMCRNRRSRELERLRLLEVANIYNVPILLSDVETVEENTKLKKVINILKEKADIRLHILTNTDGSKIYEIEFILGYYSTIYEITQQEYELLKEVLESDRN